MADLSITAASVVAGTDATFGDGTAGATITAGQVVYADGSDSNKLKLADANASLSAATALGIALHAALNNQPLKYQKTGQITIGATVAVGTIYVVSATAGGIAPAAPGVTDLATGMFTGIVGIGKTAAILDLGSGIKLSGVAVP